ncbi:hypothetical protein [Salibacter halophilus]|uniref:Uncharacterized protein n=1 Tax=Salibacter halophilus TaxID=1803916 RepID=A0A6N6MB40_9FLAO|nr:hypothetical protein [Salibacter halophilus]KAB1066066.1 hypothetical protein F3059_00945 [Salibacter halophilus]
MRNLIVLVLICFSTVTFGQTNECKKFKNGKFKIIDAEVGNSIITRKGSKQIEYGEGSKLKLEFKVKWVDDCTYTLELKKVLENPNNIELPEGMILTIEIIETKENSYVQKSTSNLYDMVLESELIKIE